MCHWHSMTRYEQPRGRRAEYKKGIHTRAETKANMSAHVSFQEMPQGHTT